MVKLISIYIVFMTISVAALADERVKCKSLDTREFGLVSTGEIVESWSEGQLIDKYGPPCIEMASGEVFIERSKGRRLELDAQTVQQDRSKTGTVAIKKQLIYKGDDSNKTSIFTIIDGIVVKKERIF